MKDIEIYEVGPRDGLQNSKFSLDWFFDSYINYSGQTDFKIHKKKSSISIKNKTFSITIL